MATTQSDSVPKTANLLACKQWWKVCFLHGDQEKYYRQIYGRAAAQRLANFPKDGEDGNKSSTDSRIIFPTKLHSPVVIENGSHDTFKLTDYQNRRKNFRDDPIVPGKSVINILDDPFLFGINEVNENGSDSGIDANCPSKQIHRKSERNNFGTKSANGFRRVDDIRAPNVLQPPPRPPKSTHQSALSAAAQQTWVVNCDSIKCCSSRALTQAPPSQDEFTLCSAREARR